MNTLLYVLFLIIASMVLMLSFVASHGKSKRTAAGWWAGIILTLVIFAAFHSSFQVLPVIPSQNNEIDWNTLITNTVNVKWSIFCLGIFLGLLVFFVIERIPVVPDKIIAFISMFLSFTSLSTILYIFLIRNESNILFSFVMGSFLGWLLHVAFVSNFEIDI